VDFFRYKYSAVILIFGFFLTPISAEATLYAPGETLDPSCAPTDVNCGVTDIIASGTANGIPFYAASGSALSATTTFTILPSGKMGVGTTTPNWNFQVAGTRPSFVLTDASAGTNLKHWVLSSMGGNLYIGTSTDAFGTSSPAAISISNAGVVTLSSALPVASGGTGLTSFTANQVLYTNGAGTGLLSAATSTLNIGGTAANVTGTVAIANGGTGWASIQTGAIPYGNGTTRLSTTTQGTGGQILAWLNGVPSWQSTTTMSIGGNAANVTGTVAIANGGTGTTGLTSNQFTFYNGTALVSASTTAISNAGGWIGIGTTTPRWLLTLASSTAPQLTLTDGSSTNFPWTLRSSGGNLYIATSSPTTFATSTTPALSIVSSSGSISGIIGIGTSTPWGKLSVEMGTLSPAFVVSNAGSTTPAFIVTGVNQNGRVGIGTTTPATTLEVGTSTAPNVTLDWYTNCTAFSTNANGLFACSASDERLKEDIVPLDASSTLAALNTLNPVSFYWNSETDRGTEQQYGFIAQDVAKVFPNLVTKTSPTPLTPDGTLTLNYNGLIAPIVLAIQHLATQVASFADSVTTNVLTAITGNFTHVRTEDLCLGSTCITETQLQQLLQGQPSQPAEAPVVSPTEEAPVSEPPQDASSTDILTPAN
jgi:hypothetical protein